MRRRENLNSRFIAKKNESIRLRNDLSLSPKPHNQTRNPTTPRFRQSIGKLASRFLASDRIGYTFVRMRLTEGKADQSALPFEFRLEDNRQTALVRKRRHQDRIGARKWRAPHAKPASIHTCSKCSWSSVDPLTQSYARNQNPQMNSGRSLRMAACRGGFSRPSPLSTVVLVLGYVSLAQQEPRPYDNL